jgi:hypothetical protein
VGTPAPRFNGRNPTNSVAINLACTTPNSRAPCGALTMPGTLRSVRFLPSVRNRLSTRSSSGVWSPNPPERSVGDSGTAGGGVEGGRPSELLREASPGELPLPRRAPCISLRSFSASCDVRAG